MAPRQLEKAAGVARWLGLAGGRAELEGDIVVVSPHLDDAAFSLGAAISRAARRGGRVTVLTVLAGNADSNAPAGPWDSDSGFESEGQAARARREEDAAACAILGAKPAWLPYGDQQYPRGGSDDEIRAAVVEAAGDGLVLLPGFPLLHEDHRWLRGLLGEAFEPERRGFYVEQPYAACWTDAPGVGSSPAPERLAEGLWRPLRAGLSDQRRKHAAYRAYRSQHEPLGEVLRPMLRFELRAGGESAVLP